MKKLFVLCIGVLISANFLTCSANAQQKDPYLTRSFPASSIKEVEAVASGGSITVSGDAGSQAVVEVFVTRDKWSADEIKRALEENYTIEINVANGKLFVEAKAKNRITNWNRQGLSISFKISVPRQVNSNLRTSGGSISISNLTGSQDFTTSGGSLSAENITGRIAGKTSGGSIKIENSNDNIDLQTSGGSITAKECNGKINLKTSGGSITMSNLSGTIKAGTSGGGLNMSNISGSIEANTSGGSVKANNVNGELKTGTTGGSVNLDGISGSVEAKTTGGSMNVTMQSVNDYVKLSCTGGSLNLTIPDGKGYNLNVSASNNLETSALSGFRGDVTNGGRNMKGTVNNGGTEIDVKGQRVKLTFK